MKQIKNNQIKSNTIDQKVLKFLEKNEIFHEY